MIKKLILLAIGAVMMVGYFYSQQPSCDKSKTELVMANIEALSNTGNENGTKLVIRCKYNCCVCATDGENVEIHGHAEIIEVIK